LIPSIERASGGRLSAARHPKSAGWLRLDTFIVCIAVVAAVASGVGSFKREGPYGGRGSVDPRVQREYDPRTGELRLVVFDSDGDLRVDTWSYMKGARLLRMEVDADDDGRIDRRSFYGDGEELHRTEHVDTNGAVIRTEYFNDGALPGSKAGTRVP
jgi:hypothetical protein